MRTAEVKVRFAADDPILTELRRATAAANKASVSSRRRAFLAGWRLSGALGRCASALRIVSETERADG